jgi:tetratricopeptide (TPR) repeat protein
MRDELTLTGGVAAGAHASTGQAPPFRALPDAPALFLSVSDPVRLEPEPPAGADLPTVPGYEIISELGRGGMGVVYLARQRSLNRHVALKMIQAGANANLTSKVRFRIEAEAVARLQHPNIVQIHEIRERDGGPFLALEYLAGGNLAQTTAGAPQPGLEAARLVETLARAVHHIHEHGIVHRDLKPTNVLLTLDGTPKLSDFGLARLTDRDGLTRSEAMIGTPSYMSPEQAGGDPRKIGVPADIYSLGAILYELLTGRVPFQGSTALETLAQVRTQEPLRPRRRQPSVSLDLETICLKCLEKEPGKRYSSALALADDLRCFLAGRPIQARPVPLWQRWWRSARRHPARVAWVAGAVALVGLLSAIGSHYRSENLLAERRTEQKYQQFVESRDEALLHGLLTPDEGALFLGAEAAASLAAADAKAREALALAGVNVDGEITTPGSGFPAERQSRVAADCYALLLVLAGVSEQQPPAGEDDRTRYRKALAILDRADELGVQTQASCLRRAHLLEMLGDSEAARAARERADSLPPDSALDYFLIGEEEYRHGHWQPAMQAFNRALAREPGHFWAQFFLAVCHLKAQQWEAGKAALNACLAQQPSFVWAYLFRSVANERLQAWPDAESDFQRALQLNPTEDARYVIYLTRGTLHFQQGEPEQAAGDFRLALALKPEQYNAYLNLAQVYLAQGRFEQAAAQMDAALRLRPPVQVVFAYHVERGRSLLREGRHDEALAACAAALKLSPGQPLPHEIRGRALLALARYEQAEGAFDDCVRGGKATSDVFRCRGLARMKLGKYPEAVDDYTRALERAPDAGIYQHRGWAHFFSDAWKLALRDFARAIELDPEASDAYTGRGLARVMLGDYREGVADAGEALRRNPGTPEMTHNLACIFAQAAGRARADSRADDRESLAAGYGSRAFEAIRQTLTMLKPEERSAFWQERILPDDALTPIRNDPRFKQLATECGRPR